jgi:hypothetical protein
MGWMTDVPAQVTADTTVPVISAKTHSARTEANSRLTSLAGLALVVMLAIQGVTILRIHQLITAHIVLGLILLGPLVVKLGSVGWRFVRYYAGDPDFVRAGPPRPLLRVLAPLVVLSTLVVFASGIVLLAVSPARGSNWLAVHKVSFILWFGVMTVHVLAYIGPAVRWTLADLAGRGAARVVVRRRSRHLTLVASVMAGVALGVAGAGWAHPWAASFGRGGH